ncbi:MAG: hypothetical protein JRG89_19720 [Deltaproteobacteria bacterium]|nr:hypothetical protein [Deltaproteobacteria bacterium]
MLTRIDRVQLAVPDRATAAQGWIQLLGAEHAGDDEIPGLGASRTRYRLGHSWIELLEPSGSGAVADAVKRRGAHLFAAGAATADLAELTARLRERGIKPLEESGQLHLSARETGGHGLRLVISADDADDAGAAEPVGAIDGLYEVTNLVSDAKAATEHCAELFGLEPAAFVPIDSRHYGYQGTLTLFDPDRLHRFEIITPHVPDNTMGRFFARAGDSLYMAFAESDELVALEERAKEAGIGHTPVRAPDHKKEREGADTLFLHPKGLGGMMLGLSRPGYAWNWSGHPERVDS